MNNISRDR
jgi:hypothetical protein